MKTSEQLLIDQIDAFQKECADAEHTDTARAHELLQFARNVVETAEYYRRSAPKPDPPIDPYELACELACEIADQALSDELGHADPSDLAWELADNAVIYPHTAREIVNGLQSDDEADAFERAAECDAFAEPPESLDRIYTIVAFFAIESLIMRYLGGDCEDPPRVCIVDSAHGRYIPQIFAERFEHLILECDATDDHGIAILEDPDHELHAEVWAEVLDNFEFESGGLEFGIGQGESGDLFFEVRGIA